MTINYDRLKPRIDDFLAADITDDDDPSGSVRIDSLQFFIRQLQAIIEADTEPTDA